MMMQSALRSTVSNDRGLQWWQTLGAAEQQAERDCSMLKYHRVWCLTTLTPVTRSGLILSESGKAFLKVQHSAIKTLKD